MKLEDANVEEMIAELFDNSKYATIVTKIFIKKGISEWPTWFVYLNWADAGLFRMIAICKSIDYSRRYSVTDLEKSVMEIQASAEDLFQVISSSKYLSNPELFTISQGYRLHKYLIKNKISIDY